MTDPSKRAMAMMARARRHVAPPPGAKRRVQAAVLASIAAGAATTMAPTAGHAATGGAAGGSAMTTGFGFGLKIVLPLLLATGAATFAGYQAYGPARSASESQAVVNSQLQPPSEVPPRAEEAVPGEAPADEQAEPVRAAADAPPAATVAEGETPSPVPSPVRPSPLKRSAAKTLPPRRASPVGDGDLEVSGASAQEPRAAESAPAQAPAPAPSVKAELVLIRRASQALRSGDAAGALQLLERHQREYPRGALSIERRGLRVFVLCRLGATAEARRERDRFLQIAGDSPMAADVRKACRGGE